MAVIGAKFLIEAQLFFFFFVLEDLFQLLFTVLVTSFVKTISGSTSCAFILALSTR